MPHVSFKQLPERNYPRKAVASGILESKRFRSTGTRVTKARSSVSLMSRLSERSANDL
jgi:hypothetical protein